MCVCNFHRRSGYRRPRSSDGIDIEGTPAPSTRTPVGSDAASSSRGCNDQTPKAPRNAKTTNAIKSGWNWKHDSRDRPELQAEVKPALQLTHGAVTRGRAGSILMPWLLIAELQYARTVSSAGRSWSHTEYCYEQQESSDESEAQDTMRLANDHRACFLSKAACLMAEHFELLAQRYPHVPGYFADCTEFNLFVGSKAQDMMRKYPEWWSALSDTDKDRALPPSDIYSMPPPIESEEHTGKQLHDPGSAPSIDHSCNRHRARSSTRLPLLETGVCLEPLQLLRSVAR